jgi:hypothetical protein
MIVWNRSPLAPNALANLPIGSIKAQGWLHEQLRLSAEGLTGRLMDIWPDVGPQNGWLGGGGDNWERGPYYARGLVALAHVLQDDRLMRRAQPWIEWSLQSQRNDGFFGPTDNDDWWARMPMLDALRWHHDATGDVRILPLLTKYFRYQLVQLPDKPLENWARPRGGDNIDSVLWLYNRTGDAFLLELADRLHGQTSDWIGELGGEGPPGEGFDFGHGVNRAMGFKEPAVYFQRSLDPRHLAVVRHGWERMLEHHGQIQGLFSGDEFLHGRGSTQGTELCTIVELLASLETALRISGELWLADAIERIAYNALPAMLSPDLRGHQYYELPNQVECTPGSRNFHIPYETALLFGPSSGFGCCTANLHMGWPQLVNHLWLATPDGGLAAVLFAPSEVTHTVEGQTLRITEDTAYPFEDTVRFTLRGQQPVTFALHVRIPQWAGRVTLKLNERPLRADEWQRTNGRVTVTHAWQPNDTLTLRLPTSVRLSQWERGSVGVERGPLVYALRIGEEWRNVGGTEPFNDYEVHPTTPWNYGLRLHPLPAPRSFRVRRSPLAQQPWAQDGASTSLTVKGKRLPNWTVTDGVSGPIPESDLSPPTPVETLTLIPFGCARLRIAMFPIVR